MKDKIKKYLMVITMVVGMMFSAAMPAFAYTDSAGQTEADTANVGTATGNSSVENGDPEDAPMQRNRQTQKNQKRKNHRAGCRGRRFLCLGTGSWWTIWQTMKASSF